MKLNLIKVLLSIILSSLITINAHAGKAKPGSGPITFNDKELKDFHVYITKKLDKFIMEDLEVEGFSFNSMQPFYANYFVINGNYKNIFQWDSKSVNLGPEKGRCSSPNCKIFAKKNKIVWKGAKKKISRKISFDELKSLMKELGFYK